MDYQEFCVKQVCHALTIGLEEKQYNEVAFKYALKSGLIGLYAETFCLDGKQVKFFDLNYSNRNYKGKKIWQNILGSEKAYDLCNQYENGEIDKPSKERGTVPFYEHIEPKSVTYSELLKLRGESVSEEKVREILDRSKIIILTYEEKKLLDGKTERFSEADEGTLIEWVEKGTLSREKADMNIQSMKDETGTFLRCDRNGFALARMAHLINHGVQFCWRNQNRLEREEIIKYFESNEHAIRVVSMTRRHT